MSNGQEQFEEHRQRAIELLQGEEVTSFYVSTVVEGSDAPPGYFDYRHEHAHSPSSNLHKNKRKAAILSGMLLRIAEEDEREISEVAEIVLENAKQLREDAEESLRRDDEFQ